jgi:hypothetical protein
MTYLASAWNRGDTADLMHVTTPDARAELDSMSKLEVDLRLDHCSPRPGMGDYLCYFDHDVTTASSGIQPGSSQAVYLVAPALKPGWYMTLVQHCG